MRGSSGCLLSCNTAVNLQLLTLTNRIAQYNATNSYETFYKYPKLFKGVGKIKHYIAKLHIDDAVTPAAMQHRRILLTLEKKLTQNWPTLNHIK